MQEGHRLDEPQVLAATESDFADWSARIEYAASSAPAASSMDSTL
jgi:hypothetical protein